MSNLRKIHLLGVGVLTPALMGHPQTAEARSVDFTSAVQMDAARGVVTTPAAAKRLLYQEVFTRSPAEKLRIAGDRIRLSEVKNNRASTVKITPKGSTPSPRVKRDVHIKSRGGSSPGIAKATTMCVTDGCQVTLTHTCTPSDTTSTK